MKHYDFLNEQILFNTGDKHAQFYTFFSDKYNIQYHELFVLAATLGFTNQKSSAKSGNGKEFRSNYLDDKEKTALYTILLSDEEVGKNIDSFSEKENWKNFRKILEEYAVGGLDYLLDNALPNRHNENFIDENYDFYARDIIGFLLDELQEDPFSF